jgi:hypothetical protein
VKANVLITRRGWRLHFAELAEEGAAVIAGHFHGLGRFEPAGKGFRWAVE